MRHFHVAHGRGLYVLTGRADAGYVACERCGARTPRSTTRPSPASPPCCARRAGYEADLSHFPIVGTCPECDDAHS